MQVGYSTAIDAGLAALHQLAGLEGLHLEISTVNLLYLIQLAPKIEATALLLTRQS